MLFFIHTVGLFCFILSNKYVESASIRDGISGFSLRKMYLDYIERNANIQEDAILSVVCFVKY